MRSKRKLVLAVVGATLVALTLAVPASAHELVVGPNGNTQWVGGFTAPEPAQSAPPMFGPLSLPPSHQMGLPHACEATRSNPSAVIFVAPPFGSCHHGMP